MFSRSRFPLRGSDESVSHIRDMVQRGAMKLQYVATDDYIADVLTKPLAKVKFEYFREKLCVLQIKVPSKGK